MISRSPADEKKQMTAVLSSMLHGLRPERRAPCGGLQWRAGSTPRGRLPQLGPGGAALPLRHAWALYHDVLAGLRQVQELLPYKLELINDFCDDSLLVVANAIGEEHGDELISMGAALFTRQDSTPTLC